MTVAVRVAEAVSFGWTVLGGSTFSGPSVLVGEGWIGDMGDMGDIGDLKLEEAADVKTGPTIRAHVIAKTRKGKICVIPRHSRDMRFLKCWLSIASPCHFGPVRKAAHSPLRASSRAPGSGLRVLRIGT